MKAIAKILMRDHSPDTRLGSPHPDGRVGVERRLNHFATLTNGNGFRQPKTKRIGAGYRKGSISHPDNKKVI